MGGGPSILGLNYFLISAIMRGKQVPVGFLLLSFCPVRKKVIVVYNVSPCCVRILGDDLTSAQRCYLTP